MNILANVLANLSTNFAEKSANYCVGYIFEEAICPEELL